VRVKFRCLLLISSLAVLASLRADDSDALSADSISDQVSAALDHMADKAVSPSSTNANNWVYWPDGSETKDAATKLRAADFKVLLSVLSQLPYYSKSDTPNCKLLFKRQALYMAMRRIVQAKDVPDLVSSPAPEALWIIIVHPEWFHDPALVSFLTSQLGDMPSDSDNQIPDWIGDGFIEFGAEPIPGKTWEWSVLDLADLNDTPAVQKALVDAVRRALDQTGTSSLFFSNALAVASHSNNMAFVSTSAELMTRLLKNGKFSYARTYRCPYDLVKTHPDLARDPAFESAAIGFLKAAPENFPAIDHEDWPLLGVLGDPVGFHNAVTLYFNKDAFSDPPNAQEYKQKTYKKQFESVLLSNIIYKGPGDKAQGVKNYLGSALFTGGQWIITAPPDAIASTPPPLDVPSHDDDAPSETADSQQVATALDRLADKSGVDHSDYNFNPDRLIESEHPDFVAGKLSAASSRVLLDTLNQTPLLSGNDFSASLLLKRYALFKALSKVVADPDLPRLLSSHAPEALWIVCAHPDWVSNPTVTSFLSTELDHVPPESIDQTPAWIEGLGFASDMYNGRPPSSPTRTWNWSVLYLASVDPDPATQKHLVGTIRRGLKTDGISPLFISDAFDVVSRSHSPAVLALAPDLMIRLIAIGQPQLGRVIFDGFTIVDSNPDLLKDPVFTAADIKFVKSDTERTSVLHGDTLMLARLGDLASLVSAVSMYSDPDLFADSQNSKSYRQSFNLEFEPRILNKFIYHGSGDRLKALNAYCKSAVFKDGQWIVTAPDYVAPAQAPAPPEQAASPDPITKPQPPSPAPALPDRVAITARVPIETLDASGQVTGVAMATVGAAYHVLRAEGQSLILQDTSGTQYRVSSQAAAASK
jgi:hypothetical protein